MNICRVCSSLAINPHMHGREDGVDLDLCDVCYWRTRAAESESRAKKAEDMLEESCLDCETNEKEREESEGFFREVLDGLMNIFPAVKEGFEDLSPEDTFGSSVLLEHIERDVDDFTRRVEEAEAQRHVLAKAVAINVNCPECVANKTCTFDMDEKGHQAYDSDCVEEILAWAEKQVRKRVKGKRQPHQKTCKTKDTPLVNV